LAGCYKLELFENALQQLAPLRKNGADMIIRRNSQFIKAGDLISSLKEDCSEL
jgi:hypothetical protein